MGAVVRLHRVETKGEYDGVRHAQGKSTRTASLTSYVYGDHAAHPRPTG